MPFERAAHWWLAVMISYWLIKHGPHSCAYLIPALAISSWRLRMKFRGFCFRAAPCITGSHSRVGRFYCSIDSALTWFLFLSFLLFLPRISLFIEWAKSASAYRAYRISFSTTNSLQSVCLLWCYCSQLFIAHSSATSAAISTFFWAISVQFEVTREYLVSYLIPTSKMWASLCIILAFRFQF